jgi:signal transduction histidine kinase/CheY-like chemotaxis protein/HPt (histidine-containing phosphotransfer) domain-containing protein
MALQPLPSASDAVAETVRWLKQLPLFADVAAESLELFVPAMQAREFVPGEVLFRQGDGGTDVYFVTRGETAIRIEQDGRVVATDSVLAGSCVGEMAALTGKPRSATVLAGKDGAAVLVVPGPRFRDLLLLQPSLGVNMLALMSERLRQTELRKQHAALSRRADELIRSKEAADAALKAKADVLASMSHELRTPLNGIIGLTEMVLETSLTQSQREYLTLVRESGESLLGLINDVLDLSKLEAGRLELEAVPFQLRDRLFETLKTLAVRAHRKGLELVCRVAPDVPDFLTGDIARLRQIVVNLVGNAVKFTEHGEVVVEVTSPRRTPTTAALEVTVRDSGIGIPKEKLAQLFQPYTQANASISRQYGGTGLGLSISAKLVEGMNGRIWAESTLGVGSAFHVSLELPVAVDSGSEQTTRATELAGKRVLLSVPHSGTAEVLSEVLKDWGLSVESVRGDDAESAVATAAADCRPFLMLLIDGRIPRWRVTMERVRTGHNLPSVVLLGTDQIREAAQCDELRLPHLLKPVGPAALFEILVGNLAYSDSPPEVGAALTMRPATAAVRKGGRILLAEDGLVNQRLAMAVLKKMGYEVTLATTGKEVLEILGGQAIDLVLMDVLMPEMDGLEATRAIRTCEQSSGKHLPIIAMTAGNSPQDVQRCLTAGMDAFVSKPFRQEELFASLQRFLTTPAAKDEDTPHSAVDWPTALRQVGGRHELLAERVSLLQQELPRVQNDLVAAAQVKDSTSLRIAAHTLKVALRAFGAPRLAVLAQQIEDASRQEDYVAARRLLSVFEQESRLLAEALSQFGGATAL